MKTWDEKVDEILEQDKLLAQIKSEPCKRHKPFEGSYLQHQDYMEQKVKRGAKQYRCNKCGYWYFSNEF